MFLVDYIKLIIKKEKVQAEVKFRALLLLKDLLRKKHKELIKYNEKKLLQRLFLLSKGKEKDKVLLQYDIKADVRVSKDFYQLLLECMDNWGKDFPTYKSYVNKRKRLVELQILCREEKFFKIPGSEDEMLYGQEHINDSGLCRFISN